MNRSRRFFHGLLLALALLVGQQAAALHELGHATQLLGTGKGAPVPHSDTQCFLSAQLCGGAAASVPETPALALETFDRPVAQQQCAALRPRHAFHSRAPPVLPV